MGDIAEMMLDGILCEGCGVLVDGAESGIPRRCSECEAEEPATDTGQHNCTTKDGRPIYRPGKTNCPQCNKLVKIAGLEQHIKMKHGEQPL